MKKINVGESLIFSRNIEDFKNSLEYLFLGGYFSNSEDFSDYEEATLEVVHAAKAASSIYGFVREGSVNGFIYFIPKSKVVFVEEPEKKTLRPFNSMEEFFNATGFEIGDVVKIKKFGNYTYDEKSIFGGVRVYIDEEFHRKDAIFGASTHSFDELFKHFKYLKNNEWHRFAIEE